MTTCSPAQAAVDASTGRPWWWSAVIYQIYPRSFADADGDGVGDLPGLTARLDAVAELGVDALWLSPFMVSPQADAGYDIADYCAVDPLFGTLEDFDALVAAAHARGLRIIVDLVPNHCSARHPWFQQALAAAAGSAERERFHFRDGRGSDGELPPTDWESVFGGPAWTRITEPDGRPGQWYLHLFDASQPDFNWQSPAVWEEFRGILRFWLDRGVDGFRVDVAHGLVKDPAFPDHRPDPASGAMGGEGAPAPYWEQPGLHEILRDWRRVLDEYDGDRALCGEAWVSTIEKTALWVRPDEMHQTFNFHYLETPWRAEVLREVIDDSLAAFSSVGAPSTWVLSNHDVVRHATRLGLTAENPQGEGIGPDFPGLPDPEQALRRGRAATALMLALPGSAYLYQGEELGLPEVLDIPDDARRDPTWFRTGGTRYGRDGCRVPLPWEAEAPAAGFSPSGRSWLPLPEGWGRHARDRQQHDPDSTLSLYRRLLRLRREHGLGTARLRWLDPAALLGPRQESERADAGEGGETADAADPAGAGGAGDAAESAAAGDVLALQVGDVVVLANLGAAPRAIRAAGEILVASAPTPGRMLGGDAVVWLDSPDVPEIH